MGRVWVECLVRVERRMEGPPFIPRYPTISSEMSASMEKLQKFVETGNEHKDFVALIEI